tara:strand:- start:4062 stop:5243 length:1182 start_codon:yes stop_codon:yes gene_type:complete
MAVSVDTVYQRVLAIANKEQRGYITPQEFNLFANQAQLEIFEQYFYDLNQFSRPHGNSTEYGDMLNILHEKMSVFNKTQQTNLTSTNTPAYAATFGSNITTNGDFSSGTTSWTAGGGTLGTIAAYDTGGLVGIQLKNDADGNGATATQATTTQAGKLYKVAVTVNTTALNTTGTNAAARAMMSFGGATSSQQVPPGQSSVTLVLYATAASASTNFVLQITAAGNTPTDLAVFSNASVQEVTGRKLNITTSDEIYRLGALMYTDSNGRFVEMQRVLPNELLYINSSPLTKPDEKSPVYVQNSIKQLSIYPSTLVSGNVAANFIVKPSKVVWAYNVVSEKAVFDGPNASNFDLHASEEVTLVNKILELAGVAMQKQDIQGFATGKDNKELQQEKS